MTIPFDLPEFDKDDPLPVSAYMCRHVQNAAETCTVAVLLGPYAIIPPARFWEICADAIERQMMARDDLD